MKIMNIEPQSHEWHEWRKGGIGSSDIAAIMAKSPFKTARKLYDEKTGMNYTIRENPYMIRGRRFEDRARETFEKHVFKKFEPICIEDDKHSFLHASLDGYCFDTDESLEIKVPGEKNWESSNEGDIPEYYQIQMQWQMMITGHNYMYYVVYAPEIPDCIYIKYEANPQWQEQLKKEALIFWDNMAKNIAPPLQKGDYIEIEDPTLEKLQSEYVAVDEEIKTLQQKQKNLKKQILDFGDGGNFKTSLLTVFWKEGRETLDKEKMIADGIDLHAYTKKGNPSYTIQIRRS